MTVNRREFLGAAAVVPLVAIPGVASVAPIEQPNPKNLPLVCHKDRIILNCKELWDAAKYLYRNPYGECRGIRVFVDPFSAIPDNGVSFWGEVLMTLTRNDIFDDSDEVRVQFYCTLESTSNLGPLPNYSVQRIG